MEMDKPRFEIGKIYKYTYTSKKDTYIIYRLLSINNTAINSWHYIELLETNHKDPFEWFMINSTVYRNSIPYDRWEVEQEIKEVFNGG